VSRVDQLFQCIICGAAYSSKQALRGHMKVHKGEYLRTNIFVKRGLWKRFGEVCRKHKTTTCHVLQVLIEAVVKSEEVGAVDLSKLTTPNPIIINVNQTFLGKPRSALKVPVAEYTHEVELPCEVCGRPAAALHSKRLEAGWIHVAVCERHHREALRSFYGDAWIPLNRAEVRRVG